MIKISLKTLLKLKTSLKHGVCKTTQFEVSSQFSKFSRFKTIQQYSGSSHQQIKQDFYNVVQLVI